MTASTHRNFHEWPTRALQTPEHAWAAMLEHIAARCRRYLPFLPPQSTLPPATDLIWDMLVVLPLMPFFAIAPSTRSHPCGES